MRKIAMFTVLLCAMLGPVCAGSLSGAYVNPEFLTKVTFGGHSHWAQPWRAYLETMPAQRFLDAQGINFNVDLSKGDSPELIAEMLARHGIRQARIEFGWGHLRFEDDSLSDDGMKRILLACRKHGIRPLILLNGHHGAPCPVRFFARTLAAPAHKGDTSIRLTDPDGLTPGYTGLCNLTDYWACEAMVTSVEGDLLHLSKPLPKDLGDAGKSIPMATLKYRPFSPPGTDDYRKTIDGWRKYTATVARFVTDALGTAGSKDKGFDIEIWNELTFGSNFLSINNYYDPHPYQYNTEAVWANLVKATADYAAEHPADFQGVALCDGFSNTIPWPASSAEPPRVSALSHHPYAGVKTYPADEYKGDALNAQLDVDRPGYVPSYTAVFPEYYSTALQTETDARDMGPLTTDIYGTKHGRYARTVDGKALPCDMWITEVGTAPNEIGVSDLSEALKLKAKTTARYCCFYPNKGVARLYLYAACAGDGWLGIVKDSFIEYSRTAKEYPHDDTAYTSPSLAVIGRVAAKMRSGLDTKPKDVRRLRLDSVSDTHDHTQFVGDGTPAHPRLYDRDVFVFLPFQVNSRRFVIPYYVMTRDVRHDLSPEEFTVRISGIDGRHARLTAYDPIHDKPVPVKPGTRTPTSITATVTACDYPCLLTIAEGNRE